MTLPFALGSLSLPDWLPPWVPVVLLVPVMLWLLLLLAMPFAVLGTRARLEAIEAQLDDLHAELRNLAPLAGPSLASHLEPPLLPQRAERAREATPQAAVGRREPRIDWPRATDDQ